MLLRDISSRLVVSSILLAALLAGPAPALAQQAVSTPVPGTVIVEWTTESEVNQAGFNIYRSENQDGPYVKLNDSLIPSSPDPLSGGVYSFADTTVKAGVTYYYELEDVELDGKTTMHGPILMTAGGNTVLQRLQPGVLLGIALAAILGAGALFVIRRQRPATRPPTVGPGSEGES